MKTAFITGFLIGHGPAMDWAGRLFLFVMSIVLTWVACARGTRLRGAFSRGKGSGVPISSAGRLITLLMAIVCFLTALGLLK